MLFKPCEQCLFLSHCKSKYEKVFSLCCRFKRIYQTDLQKLQNKRMKHTKIRVFFLCVCLCMCALFVFLLSKIGKIFTEKEGKLEEL